jgi:Protein of unknown function (DUF295)/F-box domain
MADWSQLQPDLLEAITRYLSLSDINRFSAVCKQWRFIAKQRRYAPVAQLPWMLLSEEPETRKRKLFNMSEQRHYYIDLPELRGGFCIGSSFGWVFVVSPKIEGYLVNPFTGARYKFPPLPLDIKNLKLDQVADGEITYEQHGEQKTRKLEDLQKMSIMKAVLSADPNTCEDFITIIIVRDECRIAFCRPKDNEWTFIPDVYYLIDVICYKGNFYAVGMSNRLFAIDIDPELKIKRIKYPRVREYMPGESKYLVDFFGEHLLLVLREKEDGNDDLAGGEDNLEDIVEEEDMDIGGDTAEELDEDSDDDCNQCHSLTSFFAVFELDLERKEWYEWDNLAGNAIFLGTNQAIAIRAYQLPECRTDCIYFTSCPSDVCVNNTHGHDDLGVYNLLEDSIEEIYEDHIPNTSVPTWLVPNP